MLSPATWIFDWADVVVVVGGDEEEKEQGLICFKAYGY